MRMFVLIIKKLCYIYYDFNLKMKKTFETTKVLILEATYEKNCYL